MPLTFLLLVAAGVGLRLYASRMSPVGVRPLRNAPPVSTFVSTLALALLLSWGWARIVGAEPVRLEAASTRVSVDLGITTLSLQRILVVLCGVVLIIGLQLYLKRTDAGRRRLTRMTELANGDVVYTAADGSRHTFTKSGSSYVRPPTLYATLAKGPKLARDDQMRSTRLFMRELNRFGITSVIDAGGGFQNYPEDYDIVETLHQRGELTVRLAYNLFTQKPGQELSDFQRWTQMTHPGAGDGFYRMNGAGEMLAFSAADFEDFVQPRPDLAPTMEAELEKIVELLATNKWPFRIHATYDETIDRFLTVFERVNGRAPFATRFIIDHAETVSARNIERIGALGGGIAVQHRMAFQGEYFVAQYGAKSAEATPPVARMIEAGVPVGAGTDATRVASYNPWVCLYWLTQGRTLGGLTLTPERNRVDRETALKLWTKGSAWFSGEAGSKGAIVAGELADLAVLSDDYMTVPGEEIQFIESVLTVIGGSIVYAAAEFRDRDRAALPPSPDWSPVAHGGHWRKAEQRPAPAMEAMHLASACGCARPCAMHGHAHHIAWTTPVPTDEKPAFWGALGCACFAV